MKPVRKKTIQESRKSRVFYIVGLLIAMLISVGGLLLAKMGHGGEQLLPDTFKSISLISIIGWVMGVCGVMAAAVFSRRSKGVFILTKDSISYSGVTERDRWTIQNSSIRDYAMTQSWYETRTGCSRIVLTTDNPAGSGDRVEVGPFSHKVTESWMTDLKKIIDGSAEDTGKRKGATAA